MIVQQRAAAFAATRSTAVRRGAPLVHKRALLPSSLAFQPASSYACRYHGTSSSALNLSPSSIPAFVLENPVTFTGSALAVLSLLAVLKYRGAIKRQLEILRQESWIFGAGVTMERIDDNLKDDTTASQVFEDLNLLQLAPDFQKKCQQQGWKLTTLGDYLATLRPKGLVFQKIDMPRVIQREIEAGLAAALLKALGPNLGRALLPAVGTGFVQSKAQTLASTIATKWILNNNDQEDKAGIPVPLMTLLAIADTNAKLNSGNEAALDDDTQLPDTNTTAIDKMIRGEVVKGPSFCEMEDAIPNQFVISRDFDEAIRGMELRLSQGEDYGGLASNELKLAQETVLDQETVNGNDATTELLASESYDPDDLTLGEPVPVNPRLFPDLCIGYGNALSSHTKREVLKMRLLAILLNKLGANYYKQLNGDNDLFTVQMSAESKPITTPWEFVQALLDSGHEVTVVPSSRLTTFGVGMCIKEKDGSYTNVPLGVFLESGFEDKNGRMAPAMLPHSGLDMKISGPLAGTRKDGTPSELALQHFIGIEGYCGWHPHANAVVPFNEAVPAGTPLSGEQAVRGVCLAGLYANVMNGLATELRLPFGGYGVTAVCNDSAAILQQCLYGETTIYPLTSIGRFAQRTMRYAQTMRDNLANSENEFQKEIADLDAIVQAMRSLPSDINASPTNSKSAAKRMLHTLQPKLPFVLMHDAEEVMESILDEEERQQTVKTKREKSKA